MIAKLWKIKTTDILNKIERGVDDQEISKGMTNSVDPSQLYRLLSDVGTINTPMVNAYSPFIHLSQLKNINSYHAQNACIGQAKVS